MNFRLVNGFNLKIDLNVKLENKKIIIFLSLLQNLGAILKNFSMY